MRRLSLLSGYTAAVCVLAPVLPASAAGLPLLVVHRTEDAAGCPDAKALAALVAVQMKRPALEPAAEGASSQGGLDVQIYRSEQGFTAVIQAGGKTRQLSDAGTACSGLSAALSVSIAVLLDEEPLPPPPPPTLPPVPLLPPATLGPAFVPPTLVPEPPAPPAPPVDEHDPATRRFHVSLAAAPVLTVGILETFAGGFTSEVEVRVGRFSIAGGVLVLPGQSFSFSPGTVTLDLTAGQLRGCGTAVGDDALRLVLCVEALAGSMRGVGQGYSMNHDSTLPWIAVGTSAVFHQRIWGPLSWGARAGLVTPLVKTSFVVDDKGTAFTAAPIGGAWNAELRVSIW